jgi:ribose transport system substrate-binding protein
MLAIGSGLVACSESESRSAGSPEDVAACKSEAAEATAANLQLANRDPFPTEPVEGARAEGKNFWFIGITLSNASVASFADGAEAAADSLGASMTVFDGKGTPGTVSQGINNAIAAKADGIILGATGATSVAQAVRDAEAAGIPVLDGMNGLPTEPLADGVAAQVSPDFLEAAKMHVNWALNEFGCDGVDMLNVSPLNAPQSKAYADEAVAETERLCPSCTQTVIDVPTAEAATKMTPAVQTALQRNPNVKAIMTNSDPYVPYIQAAIEATGSDAVILGHNGTQIEAAMQGDTALVAEAVYAPPVVAGWYLVDGLLRALGGETYSGTIPEALTDEPNWGTDPDLFAILPGYSDYESTFKKLWGV